MSLVYLILARGVFLVHLGFIVFIAAGMLPALRWPRIVWVHAPLLAWGLFIVPTDRACPLTEIEKSFLTRAGQATYEGGFIEHYLFGPVPGLTVESGVGLALIYGVLGFNLACYGWLLFRRVRGDRSTRL